MQAAGHHVPEVMLQAARADMPALVHTLQLVRIYNQVTGASLNHWDFQARGAMEALEAVQAAITLAVFLGSDS